MEINLYWATPIFVSKLDNMDQYNNNFKKIIKELIKNERGKKSNKGGWQSDLQDIHSQHLYYLTEKIKKECFKINEKIKNIDIVQMWINVNKKNDWNVIHQHGYNHISGTYYIKAPINSGNIVFRDPRPAAIANPFFRNFFDCGDLLNYVPEESLLLLFPSFLDHFVEPNMSEEDRISISFDIKTTT